jgi:iron complex outermembrane receptor protein
MLLGLSTGIGTEMAWAQHLEVDVDIPAGPARETVQLLAQQSGSRLLYDDRMLGDIRTNAVRAHMDVQGALILMFAHRGVGCIFMQDRIFLLQPLPLLQRSLQHCLTDTPSRSTSRRSTPGSSMPQPVEPFEEVLVPGTYLHDTDETGSFAISLDETHPLWLGATTVPQILRRLPEDFKGGPSEDTRLIEPEAITNSGLGVSGNLRGTGARATLVLVNGRRIAPSGSGGEFYDLLQIPLSAVERIDVVMDGTSALYGSDAVGGVINIITRQRFDGARLFADAGGDRDGSQHQYRFGYIGGTDWGAGHAVIAVEGYGREPLRADDRLLAHSDLSPWGPNLGSPYSSFGTLTTNNDTFAVPVGSSISPVDFRSLQSGTQNLSDVYRDSDILPRQGRGSLYAALQQEFTDHLAGFANLLWSERWTSQHQGGQPVSISIPSDTPFLTHVPADAGPLRLEYNLMDVLGAMFSKTDIRTFNLAVGLKFELRRGWRGSVTGTDSVEEQHQVTGGAGNAAVLESAVADSSFNPFDGSPVPLSTVAEMRTQPWFGLRSQFWEVNASLDGPLFTLPGGDVHAGFGGEYRNQLLQTASSAGDTSAINRSDLGRSLRAAFAELRLPFFGVRNAVRALEKLELSVSARYEDYSDFGSAWTPRYWLIYSPYAGVQIQGSFARSTRAPNLADLDESQNVSFLTEVSDPQSGGGRARAFASGTCDQLHLRGEVRARGGACDPL